MHRYRHDRFGVKMEAVLQERLKHGDRSLPSEFASAFEAPVCDRPQFVPHLSYLANFMHGREIGY